MPDRRTPGSRAGRSSVAEILLVCCAVVDGHLAVLAGSASGAPRKAPTLPLPHTPLASGEDPDIAAARAARALLGGSPAWIAQGATAAADDGRGLAITYAVLVPTGTAAPAGHTWQRTSNTSVMVARARRAVASAVALFRDRMDLEPIAFRMLPPTFTLTELQGIYELLLARRLHKASFRRVLQAAYLVQPTDAWRSEGRGRPAQLFRYAPRRGRRAAQRSVRLELLR